MYNNIYKYVGIKNVNKNVFEMYYFKEDKFKHKWWQDMKGGQPQLCGPRPDKSSIDTRITV